MGWRRENRAFAERQCVVYEVSLGNWWHEMRRHGDGAGLHLVGE